MILLIVFVDTNMCILYAKKKFNKIIKFITPQNDRGSIEDFKISSFFKTILLKLIALDRIYFIRQIF